MTFEWNNAKDWAKVYKGTSIMYEGIASYPDEKIFLSKETLKKCMPELKGRPVIIEHQAGITPENMKEHEVGYVTNCYYNNETGDFDCDFVIDDDTAKDLLDNKGYTLSTSYIAKSYGNSGTFINSKYDREITDLDFRHLAIVKNPRYERVKVYQNEVEEFDNGWITTDRIDEEGNRIKIFIEGKYGQSASERRRKSDILANYKDGDKTKFDFTHTRVKLSEIQKRHIKTIIDKIYSEFKGKGLAQVEVRTVGGGALGLCTSSSKGSIVGLDSSLYSGKVSQTDWEDEIKKGFHPKTDNKDLVTCVLTHELGHAITVNSNNDKFWNEIDKVRGDYLKNIKKEDVKNPDFISNYARVNKYEFVAEAFAQGYLSKKTGKYTKRVMDLMKEHFSKNNQLKLVAEVNNEKEDVIIWEENYGFGYPLTEEDYEKTKQDEDKKQSKEKQNDTEKEYNMDKIEVEQGFLNSLIGLVVKQFDNAKKEEKEE
ncbi:MAG: DUF2213 domain-containing protein, partial [Romboutsia timonensis]